MRALSLDLRERILSAYDNAGIVILVRRRTRLQERTALVHLLDTAGELGLRGNINFA